MQAGHAVDVVLTENAHQLFDQLPFQRSAARHLYPIYSIRGYPLGAHIELAEQADLLVIAPATARVLASCALGTSEDLLSTLYLCCECPVLMAPAMSSSMWPKRPEAQRIAACRRWCSDGWT